MSKLVKKFRKGNYDDDNYYSDEEYNKKKKGHKQQRKMKYFDEYDSYDTRRSIRPPKSKSY